MTDQELPANDAPKPSGKAIASLVLGIGSLLFFCLCPLNFPFAAGGLVLGFMSLKTANKGLAITGIVTSCLALVLGAVYLLGQALLLGLVLLTEASGSRHGSGPTPFTYDLFDEDF